MAALVGAGLCAALLTPLAAMAGFGLAATLALAVVAFVSLAAAAALALSGEFELVAAGLYTAVAVLLGALCVALDSLWPATLLLVGLTEARLAGCTLLFRLMLPSVFSAFGLVGFLSLHGMGPAGQGLAGWSAALPALAGYAGLSLLRLRRRAGMDAAADTPWLRLDAAGTILGRAAPIGRLGAAEEGVRFSQRLHLLDRVAFLKAMDDLRLGAGACDLDLRVENGGTSPGFAGLALRLVPVRDARGGLLRVEVLRRAAGEAPRPGRVADEAAILHSPALLATVSHELRTPLNAIIGFSDLLDQEVFGGFADPRQKEYVALIRRSSRHLLDVVNGLLDVSKLEAGRYELEPEAFSITDIAGAAAEMVRGEADAKGLRLVLRVAPVEDLIVADRRACQQILLNLLANAVKFTHAGTVCLAVRTEDGALVLEVTDTGIGISPDDIERLGQPFVQVSQGLARRYEGTGLGLSLVKGLAELHHGSLRIRSQPGRGTAVTVKIPTNCAERIRAGGTPSENVVALTHARKKDSLPPQVASGRLTA